MATPQSAIFFEDSTHHYFLEYNLRTGWRPAELRTALAGVLEERAPSARVMIAFGPAAWQLVAPDAMPDDFIPFHPVLGKRDRTAPGSQGDVFFWIHGLRHDLNMDLAMHIQRALSELATLELEVHGFRYLDSRDLTGFIDGTENPREHEAREVAVIPQGRPGAGGSFVLSQKWVHDLAAFERLSGEEQEAVIGRTKADSVELEDAPPTAHIRRTDVKIDGKALKIYRRSAPYGNLRESGLYFLAFSGELMRFAIQLDRMFGLSEDGLMDSLTGFSAPVSGSYWFAPPVEALVKAFGNWRD